MDVKSLSAAKCILLTVHLASESNIRALHSFTPVRNDALDPELVLRILLTYLPEAVDPQEYTNYAEEVASRLYINVDREEVEVNLAPVNDISDEEAKKRVKKLYLLQIIAPNYPPHAPKDLLTRFLCHRAYRIDAETGLLHLVPSLIGPFMKRNSFIRDWYISVVLPLLRLETEYYPEDDSFAMTLAEFEKISGREGVDLLLKNASSQSQGTVPGNNLSRDIKGLVGPWMYGHTERKRRKLENVPQRDEDSIEDATQGMRKIALEGVREGDLTGHDWERCFDWLVATSIHKSTLVAHAMEEWDGPGDVDLGGYEKGGLFILDDELQRKLELQYAQAAFASCYAAKADTEETVSVAHRILARLAELMDFIPPPDLATSVESLPRIERHATKLDKSQTVADLMPDALLRPEHPLTTPRLETYMLLQMMVYSAYQLSGLGHPLSLVNVVRLHFYASGDEQLNALRKILRHLSKTGARQDELQWASHRAKLLWLWNWGIEPDSETPEEGAGVLGKIRKDDFEEEMLKVFIETSLAEVDPVENTDVFGGIEDEDISFPFVVSDEDEQRILGNGIADGT